MGICARANRSKLRLIRLFALISLIGLATMPVWGEVPTKSGVRPQVISLPAGPGSIEGLGESYEVQLNSGNASFGVALKLPPGRAGFGPSLTLRYDGGLGNGALGLGWRLSGRWVQRQTDKGLPHYSSVDPDPYVNESGEELVRVQGGPQDEVQIFRLKNEGAFDRYIFNKPADRWEVTDRSGNRYYLGAPADGAEVAARIRHPGSGATFAWHVAEGVDSNDNRILYHYTQDQGQAYLSTIAYSLSATAPQLGHRVHFHYEERSDPVIDYRPTFRLVTGRRLRQIQITTSGQRVREYRFDYVPLRPLSILSRITEIGADGVTTLPPAEFHYSEDALVADGSLIPLPDLAWTSLLFPGENPEKYPASAELLDFDGDGLPDLYVSRHPGSPPDEYDVLYHNQGGGRFTSQYLGAQQSLGLAMQSANSFVQDMDGDGLPDLVAQIGANPEDFVLRRNTGGQWATGLVSLAFPQGVTTDNVFRDPEVRALDLNGDKRTDALRAYPTYGLSGPGVAFAAYIHQGDGSFSYIAQTMSDRVQGLSQTFAQAAGALMLADMNGDRLQDLVLVRDATNGGPLYWPGQGFGEFDDTTSGYGVTLTDGPDFGGDPAQAAPLELADVNGDGLADLYLIIGPYIRYWLNEGGLQFGPTTTLWLDYFFDPGQATYRLLDLDGDGLQEILFYVRSRPTPDYLPQGFHFVRLFEDRAPHLTDGLDNDQDGLTDEADEGTSKPNLLITASNGIGRRTSILHASHVEDRLRDAQVGNPWISPLPFPVPVIRRVDVYDGLDSLYRTDYAYHEGYYDGQEKEFRGFAAAEQREIGDASAPDLVTAYRYDTGINQEAFKGKPLQVETRDAAGEMFYLEHFDWQARTLASGAQGDGRDVVFPYQASKTRVITELGQGTPVELRWDSTYDDYGNLTRLLEHGRLDPGWDDERVTEYRYSAADPSGQNAWLLDRPVEKTLLGLDGTRIAHQRHYYDGHGTLGLVSRGNLTRTEDWVEASHYLVSERKDYDPYGNVVALYDPLWGQQPGHFRELSYDAAYHSYPVEERIHTGERILTFRAEYDPGLGKVTGSTEFNGHRTAYRYDTFGRLVAIVKPGDSQENPTDVYDYVLAHDLGDGRLINWVETKKRETTNGGSVDSRTFFDGLSRKIMTRSEGEEPGQIVVSDTVMFNSRKQPARKYLPYFDQGTLDYSLPAFTTHFTEHKYDALGREIRISQPDDSFSTTVYTPLTKTVRDEEQTDVTSKHHGGAMRYVQDGLWDKDGNGQLREVSEVVRLSDVGEPIPTPVEWTTSYRYDQRGNLTNYRDSQNNQKFVTYDGLGRKTFMNDLDRGHRYYGYDANGNLIQTTDAKNQSTYYSYDGANRIRTEHYGTDPVISPPDVRYHYDEPNSDALNHGDYWPLAGGTSRQGIEAIILGRATRTAADDLNQDGAVDVADALKASAMLDGDQLRAANTLGQLAWVEDESGEQHWSYDSRGRCEWDLKRIKDGEGRKWDFYSSNSFDAMDRSSGRVYPDGSKIEYSHNTRGLLESIPGVIDRLEYNPVGKIALLVFANGVTTSYSYDERLRVSRIHSTRKSDGLSLQDLSYSYDKVSNLALINDGRDTTTLDTIGSEIGADPESSREFKDTLTFEYDSLYRLMKAASQPNFGELIYRYDRIGNLLSVDASRLVNPNPSIDFGTISNGDGATWDRAGRAAGDPPGPHALTSTQRGIEGPNRYDYDDNGNLLTDGKRLLGWDFKDRLIALSAPGYRVQYTYNFKNARRLKVVNDTSGVTSETTSSTLYIDPYSEIRERELAKYVFFGEKRLARIYPNSKSASNTQQEDYYLHDHLGSTNLAVDQFGRVTEQLAIYPYGSGRLHANKPPYKESNYGFIGKELDIESGYLYFQERFLGTNGRFLSVDDYPSQSVEGVILTPQLLNPYAYSMNNPIVFKDITGNLPDGVQATFWARPADTAGDGIVKVRSPHNQVIMSYGQEAAQTLVGAPSKTLGYAISAYSVGDKLINGDYVGAGFEGIGEFSEGKTTISAKLAGAGWNAYQIESNLKELALIHERAEQFYNEGISAGKKLSGDSLTANYSITDDKGSKYDFRLIISRDENNNYTFMNATGSRGDLRTFFHFLTNEKDYAIDAY